MSNTTTSTTSAIKLGRQGGVSFGKGPCINAFKERTTKYISMNRASTFDSTTEIMAFATNRVPLVLNNHIAPAITSIPANAEATKADRKKLAFASKSKKPLRASPQDAVTMLTFASQGQQTDAKQKVMDVKRNSTIKQQSVLSASDSSVDDCSLHTEASSIKSAWVDRRNVSIQCDSISLLSGPAINNKSTTTVQNNAVRHHMVSDPRLSEAYLDTSDDFSAISSELSQRVTPMMMMHTAHHVKHHTPIFHSYSKQQHDSDSDEDFERGLGEYLSTTSSIAHQYSFDESPPVQLLRSKCEPSSTKAWSHVYDEDVRPKSISITRNTSSTAKSSTVLSMQTTYGLSQFSGHGKTASSSILGSATRVALAKDRPVFRSAERRAFDFTASPARFSPVHSKKKMINFSDFDATFMTDVAVVTSDYSAVMSAFDDSATMDTSAVTSIDVTKAETTLTLDHNHPLDVSLSPAEEKERGVDKGPRLAVLPLHRDKNAAEDIKEINFIAAPGAQTTVVLTISNHRHRKMCMNSHALSLRFEESSSADKDPSISTDDDVGDDDAITVETAAPKASFSVNPAELIIFPGTEGYLYVTFSPVRQLEGIYSGALKIRSHRKARALTVYLTMHSNCVYLSFIVFTVVHYAPPWRSALCKADSYEASRCDRQCWYREERNKPAIREDSAVERQYLCYEDSRE